MRQTQTIASTMFVRTGGSAGGQRQPLTQTQDTSKLWVVVSILKSVSGTEPPDTAARVYQGGEVSHILLVQPLSFTLKSLYGSLCQVNTAKNPLCRRLPCTDLPSPTTVLFVK